MVEMRFLESHIGSLDNAVTLANAFYWSVTIEQRVDQWVVLAGEKVVLMTDSRETVDAFLYGMGLAYSIIPEQLVNGFQEMFPFNGVDDQSKSE